jgi:ribonuclease-3
VKSTAPLQRALGHEFREPDHLERALTHRSRAARNNERLEFLGDALLSFVIGEALFRLRPNAEEGALSRLRASLVREESLAALARALSLGDYLQLGEGELRSGGWRRDSVLADALEAVLGAVYLDAGFDAASEVCTRLFAAQLARLPDPESLKDAKTRLQEWLQARSRPLPRYEVLEESGPPHKRQFLVRCVLQDDAAEMPARGSSRRLAEQSAAQAMLDRLDAGAQQNP